MLTKHKLKKIRSANILVTGSEGFIGKNFCSFAKKLKLKIIKVDLKKNKGTKFVDIRSNQIAKFINSSTILIHFAAISSHNLSKKNKKKTFDININGIKNLIKVCNKARVKQFIFMSSEWVYGDRQNKKILDESLKINGKRLKNSPYAFSKFTSEKLLKQKNLFPSTILRLGIVYGPRLIPQSAVENITHNVVNRKELSIGSKKTSRRYIFISDVVSGIFHSIGRSKNEVFNLSGEKLVSLNKIVNLAKNKANSKCKILEKNKKKFSIRNVVNYKAKKILEWKPKISIDKGVQTLINYYG